MSTLVTVLSVGRVCRTASNVGPVLHGLRAPRSAATFGVESWKAPCP